MEMTLLFDHSATTKQDIFRGYSWVDKVQMSGSNLPLCEMEVPVRSPLLTVAVIHDAIVDACLRQRAHEKIDSFLIDDGLDSLIPDPDVQENYFKAGVAAWFLHYRVEMPDVSQLSSAQFQTLLSLLERNGLARGGVTGASALSSVIAGIDQDANWMRHAFPC